MSDDGRMPVITALLADYVKSPSLQHLRDPHQIETLARNILKRLDRGDTLWRKWNELREKLVRMAGPCWIPVEDLRDYLNQMSGPQLTSTDVAQRMAIFNEEPYAPYPNRELKVGCLEIYAAEKAQGTELTAIITRLVVHVEDEEERLRQEQQDAWRKQVEEDRLALEQRFLSGADCKWTPINRSKDLYCRANARAFRLTPTPDKLWELYRIAALEDPDAELIGKYRTRGDASKVLAQMAFQDEPRRR